MVTVAAAVFATVTVAPPIEALLKDVIPVQVEALTLTVPELFKVTASMPVTVAPIGVAMAAAWLITNESSPRPPPIASPAVQLATPPISEELKFSSASEPTYVSAPVVNMVGTAVSEVSKTETVPVAPPAVTVRVSEPSVRASAVRETPIIADPVASIVTVPVSAPPTTSPEDTPVIA